MGAVRSRSAADMVADPVTREVRLINDLLIAGAFKEDLDVQTSDRMTPYFPDIEVQLTGRSGNAGAIMGSVAEALRRNFVPAEAIDLYRVISMSGDYDALLMTAMRWVEVA